MSSGSTPRNFLAAIDTATGAPTDWNPTYPLYYQSLAVSGQSVIAGGSFIDDGQSPFAIFDATTGNKSY